MNKTSTNMRTEKVASTVAVGGAAVALGAGITYWLRQKRKTGHTKESSENS